MGLDVGVVLEGLVDDAPVVGVHGLELDDVAPATDLLGSLLGALDELLAGLAAVAPDVEHDARGGFVSAVDDAVEEVLEVAQGRALAADEAAGVAVSETVDITRGEPVASPLASPAPAALMALTWNK